MRILQIADDTGGVYTTFFGEQGEQLLNMNAKDFGDLLDEKEGAKEKDFEKAINYPIFRVSYLEHFLYYVYNFPI